MRLVRPMPGSTMKASIASILATSRWTTGAYRFSPRSSSDYFPNIFTIAYSPRPRFSIPVITSDVLAKFPRLYYRADVPGTSYQIRAISPRRNAEIRYALAVNYFFTKNEISNLSPCDRTPPYVDDSGRYRSVPMDRQICAFELQANRDGATTWEHRAIG